MGSSDQLQNNANNIKGLAFYHEIRWSLKKVSLLRERKSLIRGVTGIVLTASLSGISVSLWVFAVVLVLTAQVSGKFGSCIA